MMDFNEQELEQVNEALRGTIQNLTAKLVAQADEIADLKQRVANAEKFFASMSVYELARQCQWQREQLLKGIPE